MSVHWPALKAGDTVRIIAPGAQSKLAMTDLQKCCDYLSALKLKPLFSPSLFAEVNSYYHFANTDEARYQDLIESLESDAAAIWCFRGGYGSDRLVDKLYKENFSPFTPKIFIGFSDVTNLHSFFNKFWGWSTLHASVLKQLNNEQLRKTDFERIENIIFGRVQHVELSLVALNSAAKDCTTVSGKICGGNLTTLQCALGTPWEVDVNNNILVLEDTDEAPYRIARMLQQLLVNQYLKNAGAIILGDFISSHPGMDQCLQEFASQCSLPVLRCEGIGHGNINYPLPLGTNAKLTLGSKPLLWASTGVYHAVLKEKMKV